MLVLLHFHQLGYSSIDIAFLFLLYEFCGIGTNLFGGWLASRVGLRFTLYAGLSTQIVALVMLSLLDPSWSSFVSVTFVMISQALSGIAKDLTKMSSKSAVKLLVSKEGQEENHSTLFKWVSVLTGSKNALKGVGFFLGSFLLVNLGFTYSLWLMAAGLIIILLSLQTLLTGDIGKSDAKVKFKQLFSKSREINILSLARFFLFASRDVWFVVALPVFLASHLNWSFEAVGGFLAIWVIGYGFVQALAPRLTRKSSQVSDNVRSVRVWGLLLLVCSLGLSLAIQFGLPATPSILIGLAIFGFVFAINSALHSYLILAYTDSDKVALNVGFYYMANACGRLVGTLLSGVLYLLGGLEICLWGSTGMILIAAALTLLLPLDIINTRLAGVSDA